MKTATLAMTSVLAVSALAGCDFDRDVVPGTFTEDNNNIRLDAEPVGEGDRPFVAKTVEVEVTRSVITSQWEEKAYDALEVSDARLVRSENSQYTDVYFEVVNEGGTPLCFVGAEMTLLDADGESITEDFTYLEGSVAKDFLSVESCLAPDGGFGFVATMIPDVDPEQVASFQIEIDGDDAIEWNAPDSNVVATRFASAEVAGFGGAAVTLRNEGTANAGVAMAKLIRFDEDGEFLDWSYSQDIEPEVLGPGDEAVALFPLVGAVGDATEVMVHVMWED